MYAHDSLELFLSHISIGYVVLRKFFKDSADNIKVTHMYTHDSLELFLSHISIGYVVLRKFFIDSAN